MNGKVKRKERRKERLQNKIKNSEETCLEKLSDRVKITHLVSDLNQSLSDPKAQAI